jgi:hypothetical protein
MPRTPGERWSAAERIEAKLCPPAWAASRSRENRIAAAPTWVITAYHSAALRVAWLRRWSTSTSSSEVRAMSSHSTRKVATLPAAGTSSMVVTNSGRTTETVRVESPWLAYPIQYSVAAAATTAVTMTKTAPSGSRTMSTPVIGRIWVECSTMG